MQTSTDQRCIHCEGGEHVQTNSTLDYLTKLPVEILQVICENSDLKPADLHAMSVVCAILHEVASQTLYKHIHVSGHQGRHFCDTVGRIPRTTLFYGSYIRSLSFGICSRSDVCFSVTPLCAALVRMETLEDLTIILPSRVVKFVQQILTDLALVLPTRFTKFLVNQMKNRRIPPDLGSTLTTFVNPEPITFIEGRISSVPLPKLRKVSFRGDPVTLPAARQPSSFVEILEPIRLDELAIVIDNLSAPTVCEAPVRSLAVALDLSSSVQVIEALWTISVSLPDLKKLSIYSPRVNALLVSFILSHSSCIFPTLQAFSLNRSKGIFPIFIPKQQECLEIQGEHIKKSMEMRPDLSCIMFGSISWFPSPSSPIPLMRFDGAFWDQMPLTLSELWDLDENRGALRDIHYTVFKEPVPFPPQPVG